MSKIDIDIQDGPVTPDFDGGSRGWQARLILDPESREVTVYAAIGGAVSAPLWHGRWLSVSLSAAASGEHLRELLNGEEAMGLLHDIFDCYRGCRWDGHNNVGEWEYEVHDETEHGTVKTWPHHAMVESLQRLVEDVPRFWSAADWLEPAWSECKREVQKVIEKTEEGSGREDALKALVDEWVTDAHANDALIDESDLLKVVETMVKDLQDEDGDEGA